jgi:hypothetical protein
MYMWAVVSGYVSGFPDIPALLANVENAVLLRCVDSPDSMFNVAKHDIQCASDYQRHTCPTI